jgi:hypothetical protein
MFILVPPIVSTHHFSAIFSQPGLHSPPKLTAECQMSWHFQCQSLHVVRTYGYQKNTLLTMTTESHMRPITTDLPSTLAEWRTYRTSEILVVWVQLRPWFPSEGLDIFDNETGSTIVNPPVKVLRAHDGTYGTHYASPNIAHQHRVYGHNLLRCICADVGHRGQSIALLELQRGVMSSSV